MQSIKTHFNYFLFGLAFLSCAKNGTVSNSGAGSDRDTARPVFNYQSVDEWITQGDKSLLFNENKNTIKFSNASNLYPAIEIDSTQKFQQIDGFGFCLTDASAYLISQMSATQRTHLLKELFASDSTNIGISYIRVSIGASDLSRNVYSYDDMPSGQIDTALSHFSLANEEAQTTIAVIKQILSIHPNLKILGSPWSPPVWMKDNNATKGGSLKPEYYHVYADYFVKYLKGMQQNGITLDAITPQNEPLNPDNNPSLYMSADEEADFIKNDLGPALAKAGIATKIWVYDHNCDKPDYPMTILADTDAAKYVDGAAFHLYSGNISALGSVHNAYPDKNVYFTEQYTASSSTFGADLTWAVQNLIIGSTKNWSKNVLEWNLASDPSLSLHTKGGCTTCLGAVTINANTVSRNQSYYIIAHASKFVKAGSYRISTNDIANLYNVAFLTPDGTKVLIVLNAGLQAQNFNIKFNGKTAACLLNSNSVATYVWK